MLLVLALLLLWFLFDDFRPPTTATDCDHGEILASLATIVALDPTFNNFELTIQNHGCTGTIKKLAKVGNETEAQEPECHWLNLCKYPIDTLRWIPQDKGIGHFRVRVSPCEPKKTGESQSGPQTVRIISLYTLDDDEPRVRRALEELVDRCSKDQNCASGAEP
jgi:hypothetical protein